MHETPNEIYKRVEKRNNEVYMVLGLMMTFLVGFLIGIFTMNYLKNMEIEIKQKKCVTEIKNGKK